MDQLELLKRTELELVKEFHRICEENNLRYTLSMGSMIGCVRHKGFIPWDDDIDVVMPWEDYCIFNEIANSCAKEEYMVFNEKTVKDYAYPFAKFIKKQSCAIFEYPFKHYHDQPVYIDIFPGLLVPKSKLKRKRIQFSNFFYSQTGRMRSSSPYKNTKRGIVAKFGMFLFYCLNKIIPQRVCYKRMMKIAVSVKRENAERYYVGDLYSQTKSIVKFPMPLDVFDTRIRMQFEDTQLYMPKDYDSILRIMYGDYMKLPPEEQRKSHGFKFVSDTMSYQEYDQQQRQKQVSE